MSLEQRHYWLSVKRNRLLRSWGIAKTDGERERLFRNAVRLKAKQDAVRHKASLRHEEWAREYYEKPN